MYFGATSMVIADTKVLYASYVLSGPIISELFN